MSCQRRSIWAALAALLLSACTTLPPPAAPSPPPKTPSPNSLAALPGWDAEDHTAALAIVRTACAEAPLAGGDPACAALANLPRLDEATARRFLETRFRAEPVDGDGLLTAYYSPAYAARRVADGEFSAPVRPMIAQTESLSRAAIAPLPAAGALAWMRPEDLFLLQVQGSGVLTFPDGRRARAVFAGTNGLPFVAIAGPMVAAALIPRAEASSAAVHAWLAAHRGPEADAQMDKDPRYVFFSLVPDDGGEPAGASGARLVPGRSLAIDPARHPYFELLWVDARVGTLSGARPSYQRLAVALDRGGAITGPVRADLYLGSGAAAGEEAARVRHSLRLYRILPR